ncbi:hypothetical protein [Rhodococcus sp. APC 3903]|uniref:hypothetical protein n=1 Tax=Rhodococcus sp. APC 3903 TaxID=3035193 RepID=UPI0025B5C796|nr:hypothetical protein [Rhodococcus sp. APC 3903]MDN3461130.1 hypothetical protein [Rhodococcus sp. APC 3903]
MRAGWCLRDRTITTRDELCMALDAPPPHADVITAHQYDSDEIAVAVERFGALLRTPMPLPVLLQSVCAQVGCSA